jgi:ABC transporter substrate binding protein
MASQRIGTLIVGSDPLFFVERTKLVVQMARHALPAIFADREQAEAGGLISYGTSRPDAYRQAGAYVGRIVKGEKPRDLPVMLPTKISSTHQSQDREIAAHRHPDNRARPRRRGHRMKRRKFITLLVSTEISGAVNRLNQHSIKQRGGTREIIRRKRPQRLSYDRLKRLTGKFSTSFG